MKKRETAQSGNRGIRRAAVVAELEDMRTRDPDGHAALMQILEALVVIARRK